MPASTRVVNGRRLVTVSEAARAVGRDHGALAYRIEKGELVALREARGESTRIFVDLDEVRQLRWRTPAREPREPTARPPMERRGPMLPDATRRQLVYPEALKSDGRACAGMDPELFFAESGEAVARAKAACAECPVLEVCRSWARQREEFGTWAGETARERAAWRRANAVRLMSAAVLR